MEKFPETHHHSELGADLHPKKTKCIPTQKEPAGGVNLLEKINDKKDVIVPPHVLLKKENSLKKNNDPYGFILEGYRYEEEGDCKQAVKSFLKAAELGNAAGMFRLGCMRQEEGDFYKALQFYNSAAACPPFLPDGTGSIGVSESELHIGYMYANAIGVTQDFVYATELYKKSSDHGNGSGSLALALCYLRGDGVEESPERANQYFKLASWRGNVPAMGYVARHFAYHERDPAQARLWYRCSLQNGDKLPKEISEDLLKLIKKLETHDPVIEELEAFETDHGFTKKNLTFDQRFSRMKETLIAPGDTAELSRVHSIPEYPSMMNYLKNQFNPKLLNEYARNGFKTAQSALKAFKHFIKGLEIMLQADFSNKDKEIIVHEIAEGIRAELGVAKCVEHEAEKINLIVKEILGTRIEDSDFEKDARVCYAVVQNVLNTDENEKITFLEESIKKFSEEVVFYRMKISELTKKKQCSIQEISHALTLFPNDLELLSYKRLTQGFDEPVDIDAVIEMTNDFLAEAPSDHRHVPDCYYHIAWLCLNTMIEINDTFEVQKRSEMNEILFKYYKLGLEAEKNQLHCFLSYNNSKKCALEKYIAEVNPRNHPAASKNYSTETQMDKLVDFCRIDIIVNHRRLVGGINSKLSDNLMTERYGFDKYSEKKFNQRAPVRTSGLKPITLREMPPMEQLYEGRVIKLTIVEDALILEDICRIVGEDRHGDVQRVDIYDLSRTDLYKFEIGFGCRISIMNPCMYFGSDEKFSLRVDDYKSVFFHLSEGERGEQM